MKVRGVYSLTSVVSTGFSVVLLLASTVFSVEDVDSIGKNPATTTTTAAPEIVVDICNTSFSSRNIETPTLKPIDQVLYCNSTQPINWITTGTFNLSRGSENETELPFGIETKIEKCGSWRMPLSNGTAENSTIPHYFASTIRFNTRNYSSSLVNMELFCGTFTYSENSTTFQGIKLTGLKQDGQYLQHPNSTLSQMQCDKSGLIEYKNESSGNCSCLSPKLFHCDDLMECRFLAHWKSSSKSKKACVVRKVENLCNSTSFSLPNSSRRKGGLLFCESNKEDRDPYILFYPSPQEPNSTNMTNATTGNSLTKIQILGNDTEDYEQFLDLFILSRKDEKDLTTSSEVEMECKGPAFLFIQGFLWNVTVNSKESKSELLPNFNISDPETKNSSDGEKYVSSTLRISPDDRNESLVLHVACAAALSDGNVFITSNRKVKLEVYKPQVMGEITCLQDSLLFYKCNTEQNVNWTWVHENGTEYKKESGESEKEISLKNCPNETIICTATLPNGVNNSYHFQKEHCANFTRVNCTGLPKETTTPNRTYPKETDTTPTSSPEGTEDHSHHTVIIAISSVFGAFLLILVPCVIVLMRKNRKHRDRLKMSDEDVNDFIRGNDSSVHFLPYDTRLEIPKDQITIGTKVLGSGAFGKVIEGQHGDKRVAIKTVNKSADVQYFKALLSEIKVMGFVGKHENVLELVGACTWDIKRRNVYAVFELCENGSLIQFLRKNRDNFEPQPQKQSNHLSLDASGFRKSLSQRLSMILSSSNAHTNRKMKDHDLVRWSMEIASGMDVIAQKKIYHGDLAARNILLDSNLVAKVGDFGLSRQLFEYSVYVQKMGCPLPLKWMSIESLRDLEFSIQSDVWSYGITLWEIFSLGCQPYPNLEWNFASWKSLLDGERMEKPEYASDSIYEIMLKCWNEKPNDRPTFAQLKTMFEDECRKVM